MWYKDGYLHREDGPAYENPGKSKAWYKNGKLHREDGPAVTYNNGTKYWYIDGKRLSEQSFKFYKRHKKLELIDILSKACMYAQEHIDDSAAWDISKEHRRQLLQCVSYQISCFLAQNTRSGKEGVEWDIILDKLSEYPMKTEKEWKKLIDNTADLYGGWKQTNYD